MKIPKPTDADKEFFRSLVPDEDPRVTVKPMFGNLGAFVNGNMFMGLFGGSVGVRLDEAGRAELSEVSGSGPFGPEGRPMKEYVALPAELRDDFESAAVWVERALAHGAQLPPK